MYMHAFKSDHMQIIHRESKWGLLLNNCLYSVPKSDHINF